MLDSSRRLCLSSRCNIAWFPFSDGFDDILRDFFRSALHGGTVSQIVYIPRNLPAFIHSFEYLYACRGDDSGRALRSVQNLADWNGYATRNLNLGCEGHPRRDKPWVFVLQIGNNALEGEVKGWWLWVPLPLRCPLAVEPLCEIHTEQCGNPDKRVTVTIRWIKVKIYKDFSDVPYRQRNGPIQCRCIEVGNTVPEQKTESVFWLVNVMPLCIEAVVNRLTEKKSPAGLWPKSCLHQLRC